MPASKEPIESAAEITGAIEGLAEKIAEMERRAAKSRRPHLAAPAVATRWRMIAVITCCVVTCLLLAWLGFLFFASPWSW